MKRKIVLILLCLVLTMAVLLWPANAAEEKTPFITSTTTTEDAVLAAIENSSYIKLGADLEMTLNGQTLVIDLAGYNLTLKGTGVVYGFDSANDTFDHLSCGILTAEEGITCQQVFVAPNDNQYVALTEGNYTTFHRIQNFRHL